MGGCAKGTDDRNSKPLEGKDRELQNPIHQSSYQ